MGKNDEHRAPQNQGARDKPRKTTPPLVDRDASGKSPDILSHAGQRLKNGQPRPGALEAALERLSLREQRYPPQPPRSSLVPATSFAIYPLRWPTWQGSC